MLEVLTDPCCSKTYLDMMKHTAMNSSSWNMLKPIGLDDKHLQLPIIENEPLEPILAGMAMGLLIQIYDKGAKVQNRFGGDSIDLNALELSIYDTIIGCEQFGKYDEVRLGRDWFAKFSPKAYMVLLD